MTKIAEPEQLRAPHFLSLPAHIRDDIYSSVEIVGSTEVYFIDLNHRGRHNFHGIHRIKQQFNATHSLFLTCRTTYAEVSARVYATNHFYIRFHDRRNLTALCRLRPTSLRSLQLLTIHLNVASCGLGGRCGYATYRHACYTSKTFDSPLRIGDPMIQTMLSEWHHTWVERLLPILSGPPRLRLNFVCDVADIEVGRLVVQPFMEGSTGRLADLFIRLGHRRDRNLRALAESAVLAAAEDRDFTSGPSENHSVLPFRYLDLPPEIREAILSYTDLITPYREVEWNQSQGLYYRYQTHHEDVSLYLEDISLFCGLPRFRRGDLNKARYVGCWEGTSPSGCFCQANHSAASNINHCHCWRNPTAMFLVCKTIREEALRVFYGQNRFVVAPSGGATWDPIEKSPERLPASVFLTSVVPRDGLQFLRYLEIVVPPLGGPEGPCTYCPVQSAGWLEWIHTLQTVKSNSNPLRLTLNVHFSQVWYNQYMSDIPDWRQSITEEQMAIHRQSYLNLILPLKSLGGLNRFFVHIRDPAEFVEIRTEEYPPPRWLSALEEEIEKDVMGMDYDALKAGKDKQVQSRWLTSHLALDWDY